MNYYCRSSHLKTKFNFLSKVTDKDNKIYLLNNIFTIQIFKIKTLTYIDTHYAISNGFQYLGAMSWYPEMKKYERSFPRSS